MQRRDLCAQPGDICVVVDHVVRARQAMRARGLGCDDRSNFVRLKSTAADYPIDLRLFVTIHHQYTMNLIATAARFEQQWDYQDDIG